MNWQPGDMAVLQNCMRVTELNGKECEIISLRSATNYPNAENEYIGIVPGYPSGHCDGLWCFAYRHLRPFDDGNETVSWESMRKIWQPKKDTVSEPGFMLKEQAE